MADPPGELGGYRLERELGRGAAGVVYAARSPGGTPVALKVLHPPGYLDEEQRSHLRSRFLREARALQAVDHPNVVRILDLGDTDGSLYLAMELLEGENLRQRLASRGPLPPKQAAELVAQLCDALEAVHAAGIVHRDVKPENVVVTAGDRVKLTDFGVAWVENEATLTRTGGVLGSPAYMAPEQILGRRVDRRADLFAACATLHQLLADRLPFPGESLLEMAHNVAYAEPGPLPPEVPPALAEVLRRGLHKSPAGRPVSAAELARDLRRAVARGARTAALPTPTPPAAPHDGVSPFDPCARHPRQPALGSCLACGKALCRYCARRERPPYYCALHRPVTVLGINPVRLEVLLAACLFLLLLLCLSPLGYEALRR